MFWELQPKDIMIMVEGFKEQREYKERVHLETLRLLRYNGYTTLATTPMKKGARIPKVTNYYPLPYDDVSKDIMSKEEQIEQWQQLDPFITNGKKRGYIDFKGNLYKDIEGRFKIGYIENNEIQYIN